MNAPAAAPSRPRRPIGGAGGLAGLRERLRGSLAGRALLWAAMLFYGAAVRLRSGLYALRLLPSRRLRARTICVGNLTVGGTGKTSAVLLAAQTLHRRQVKTAILTRGYGRRGSREVQVLLNSRNVPWQETGDEPWLMHHALKGLEIPILISPDRYRAGLTAQTYYNPEVVLLDDGFSHRALRRDLDIVLLHARDPFGGGRLLPAGDLREPVTALRRAGLVVISHADQVPAEAVESIRERVARLRADLPVVEAAHRPDFVFDIKEDRRRRLTHLRNKAVACFSAIGDPQGFEELLERSGARLVQRWRYPDHHPFTLDELRTIEAVRGGAPVVTTFKDLPRLPRGWQEILAGEVLALAVRLEITKGKELWEEALCGPASGQASGQGAAPNA